MLTANRVRKLLNSFPPFPGDLPHGWVHPGLAERGEARIWTTNDSVEIQLDLPGRRLEDIQVVSEKDHLTVTSSARDGADEANTRPVVRERGHGPKQMEFTLPFAIQADLTEVVYQNGILKIAVRKPAEDQPRKLDVRSGS